MTYCEIFKKYKNIAVVGISGNPNRTSRQIADYLVRNGFNVVGVNPGIKLAGDIVVYPSLEDIPHKINIVNVFRKSEDIPQLIPGVLAIKPEVLWLQLGITNHDAVKPVAEMGITVVQDSCIKVEHSFC